MRHNELKRTHRNKKKKTVGRGGRRGKTSGRGTKGQKARSGHKLRPEIRDIIKKLPRLRGRGKHQLKSIAGNTFTVNLNILDTAYAAGETVSYDTLKQKGLAGARKDLVTIKILGDGMIMKALKIAGLSVSQSAREKLEKAGGAISEK